MTDCDNHLILSTLAKQGPATDVAELLPLMDRMCGNVVFDTLLADAGYDSEENHRLLRDDLQIDSLIPARHGRPTDKLPTGRYRYLMQTAFDEEAYGQRWQSETSFFMIKRHQGDSLKARQRWSRHRELGLMAITHNIMIPCA